MVATATEFQSAGQTHLALGRQVANEGNLLGDSVKVLHVERDLGSMCKQI